MITMITPSDSPLTSAYSPMQFAARRRFLPPPNENFVSHAPFPFVYCYSYYTVNDYLLGSRAEGAIRYFTNPDESRKSKLKFLRITPDLLVCVCELCN